ncbi:uncharacterized protein EV422DRAFT_536328 [Fimicolochytrium jonesii]|uniref:uncharacterized protein n=1 Tax=Fimicolochytrium jonesii TaxID=1396493 RepID=UPI0022FDC9E0|nr:uncharacterized protein EV422DRAFT_536328 [Fimicolochytrium jonesii]KAI8819016.1 hypothetical protein EV422DRAFT_536328 [Fimicolochytrium jonesii]
MRLKLPASEATADNATTAHMVKSLIDPTQSRWLLEEGELQSLGSIVARNRTGKIGKRSTAGQKLDLRVTLADTNDQLEGLVCLRSGGLPRPGLAKFHLDRVDLLECLMEIVFAFGLENSGVLSEKIGGLFVMGIQSYDWSSYVYGLRWRTEGVFCAGLLKRFKLPRSLSNLAIVENGVYSLLRVEATLQTLVRKANEISLLKARLNSRERRATLGITQPYMAPPPFGCIARSRRKLNTEVNEDRYV